MFEPLHRTVRIIGKTGLLRPWPLWALLQLGWCLSAYGASLYTLVAWNARRRPEATALREADQTTSFRALKAAADQVAGQLAGQLETELAAGGQRVGLLGRNSAGFVAVVLACGRLSCDLVLLNTSHSPRSVAATCHVHRLDLLIVDDELLAPLTGLAELTGQTELDTPLRLIPLSRLMTIPTDRFQHPPPRNRRRGSLALLSSGSTGTPKLVTRRPSAGQFWQTLLALTDQIDLRSGAPTLLTLPLFHGHGLSTLSLSLLLGAPLSLSSGGAAAQWRELSEHQIEVLVLVPTVLYRLLKVEGMAAPTRLRTIICGSAPLSSELATRALERFGPVLHNLYGASEAGLISLATPADLAVSPGSVGRVLPGVTLTLQDDQGQPALPGQAGRISLRGSRLAVTDGERQMSEVQTGDVGIFDEAGRLSLLGRQDDLIIIGGENVWPQMIEELIAELDNVLDCAVRGVPDEEYGQRLQALVVLRPGASATTDPVAELHRLLATRLPRSLRPAEIVLVPALPRTALGKLQRRELDIRTPLNS